MNKDKIEILLRKYFEGESTSEDERMLESYFRSENVAEEFMEYTDFFKGISDLANTPENSGFEEEIMDFILETENREKKKYRWLWQTVTGIAASVIIILGAFLFYQQQHKPLDDTFKNPQEAYAYAKQTLQFISAKYNKGISELKDFDKLNKATQPVKKGVAPVNEFYNTIEKIEKSGNEIGFTKENRKSTDSI